MENSTQNNVNQSASLEINEQSKDFLMETAKWAKFLAILGFVGMGFMVLAGLFSGAALSNLPGRATAMMPFSPMMISVFYIVLAVVYFFPVNFLYKFANNTKVAILSGNNGAMNEAFRYLKSHYKFMGIFTIVMFVLSIVFVLWALTMASSMAPTPPSYY